MTKETTKNTENVESTEEVLEIGIEELEALLGQGGASENINITEMLETEMVRSRSLYMNQEIDTETIDHLIQLINKWNRDDYGLDVESRIPITIYVNSGGGSLYDSLVLSSTIENSVTPVYTIGQGLIASGALVVYLAGHYKYLSKFANLMYHELRSSLPQSTLREMQNTVKHYEYLQNTLDDFIVDRTDVPMKKLKKQRKKNLDWFITLKQATKYGLYDELIE